MWCKTNGEKENRRPNGDVGIEGNSGSDGKGDWSEIVWTCAKEGWWVCFENSVGVWSEVQEEDTSKEGEKECWFGEGGCLE